MGVYLYLLFSLKMKQDKAGLPVPLFLPLSFFILQNVILNDIVSLGVLFGVLDLLLSFW